MTPAQFIISRFGSHRDAAAAFGLPSSTVSEWARKGLIPAWHTRRVLNAAVAAGVDVVAADFVPTDDGAAPRAGSAEQRPRRASPGHDAGAAQCGQ